MTTKTRKKINKDKGKRYTEQEKLNVLDFVDEWNRKHGRGGITHAAKKFGITPLTIGNWCKGRPIQTNGNLVSSDKKKILSKLLTLAPKIEKCEKELVEMRREYQKLKRSL